jgi:hypothetical protein
MRSLAPQQHSQLAAKQLFQIAFSKRGTHIASFPANAATRFRNNRADVTGKRMFRWG